MTRSALVVIITVIISVISPRSIRASDGEKITPVQLALFHPVQLFDSERCVYGVRVNLLYGFNRAVYGIDAGVVNRAEDMYGVQAGLCNIAQQNVGGIQAGALNIHPNTARYTLHAGIIGNWGDTVRPGLQIGGLFNLSVDMMKGIQAAGLVNVAGNVIGLQAAGLGNAFYGDVRGIQVGGIGNKSMMLLGREGDVTGLQVGGLFNWNRNTTGAQITALLNRSGGDVYGVQIGIVNLADRVKGVQVGLVNITRRMSGVQVGLVNIISEGAVPVLPLFNASSSF